MDTDRDQATPEKTGRGRRRQQEVGDEEKELSKKKKPKDSWYMCHGMASPYCRTILVLKC
jgi:hypothetical protein